MSTIYVNNIAPKTASGPISFTNDLEASSLTIASLQTSGGLAVVKDARIGGDLIVTGNYINNVSSVKTTTATITTDETVILCGHATIPFTLTLYTAVGNTGRRIDIKNINVSVVTVEGDGVETIDGALNYLLSSQYDTLTVISDGTQWLIL